MSLVISRVLLSRTFFWWIIVWKTKKELQSFTWAVALAALIWHSSEGGRMLQSFGLVLKDRRWQLLQRAAQQVGCFLCPFMTSKLPAPHWKYKKVRIECKTRALRRRFSTMEGMSDMSTAGWKRKNTGKSSLAKLNAESVELGKAYDFSE